MVVYSFQERDNFALLERVNVAEHFDAESLHDHVVAGVILKESMQVLLLFKDLEYLSVVKVLVFAKPVHRHDFQLHVLADEVQNGSHDLHLIDVVAVVSQRVQAGLNDLTLHILALVDVRFIF